MLLAGSLIHKRDLPNNLRELGFSAVKTLPANIGMVQGFMKASNWKLAQQQVLEGLNNTMVIVGQPNTGKSTLFNKLKGQNLSPTSAQVWHNSTLCAY